MAILTQKWMINNTNPELAFLKSPLEGEVWRGLKIIIR